VAGQRRLTTVEIIVDEQPWASAPSPPAPDAPPTPRAPLAEPSELVALQVAPHEVAIRLRTKEAGGRWDASRRVWRLEMRRVRVLGLQQRIVPERY